MTQELEIEDIQQHQGGFLRHYLNQIKCLLTNDGEKNGEFWKEKVEQELQTLKDRVTALE